MPKVTYIEHNGTPHTVDVPVGLSVMRGAFDNGIPGIDADCGGACACAACHVYVEPAWQATTGKPNDRESEMLSFTAEANDASRLSCQIEITAAMDGLVVRLPEAQH